MPVRIVFRGLMIFQIPETGANAGKLVAYLINKPGFADAKRRGHPHEHDAEIQILTGDEPENDRGPKRLTRNAKLDILVPRDKKGVKPGRSFYRHVPDLAEVIGKATPAIRDAGRDKPNPALIQNVVTVDGGLVRVKEVVGWDQGGYPLSELSGNRGEPGERAMSPALAKFMGSSVRGHMASEIVVDIDAEGVELQCDHDNRFRGPKNGSKDPKDPHLPAGTVEIVVQNYEPASEWPTPWGLDFQWLFEAAGYREANLAGDEFTAWVGSGRAYNRNLFDVERTLFFGADGTMGRPFPYIESAASLTVLQPLTNAPNYWVCVFALVAGTYTML